MGGCGCGVRGWGGGGGGVEQGGTCRGGGGRPHLSWGVIPSVRLNGGTRRRLRPHPYLSTSSRPACNLQVQPRSENGCARPPATPSGFQFKNPLFGGRAGGGGKESVAARKGIQAGLGFGSSSSILSCPEYKFQYKRAALPNGGDGGNSLGGDGVADGDNMPCHQALVVWWVPNVDGASL